MIVDIERLLLDELRCIRGTIDNLCEDAQEIKIRTGRLESNVAQVQASLADQSLRLDRMDGRIERIEKRLDLVEL